MISYIQTVLLYTGGYGERIVPTREPQKKSTELTSSTTTWPTAGAAQQKSVHAIYSFQFGPALALGHAHHSFMLWGYTAVVAECFCSLSKSVHHSNTLNTQSPDKQAGTERFEPPTQIFCCRAHTHTPHHHYSVSVSRLLYCGETYAISSWAVDARQHQPHADASLQLQQYSTTSND